MKEGLGWLDRHFFLQKSIKNETDLFEPPLSPLLGNEGIFKPQINKCKTHLILSLNLSCLYKKLKVTSLRLLDYA